MGAKYNFWIGALIICLSHFIMDFMLGVWPVYKTLVGLDLATAGLIAGLSMLIGEGLQLYFGALSDRGFHKYLIAAGVGLTATIPFLVYVDNEWMLFFCVLAAFIGSGAFHPAASSLLSTSSAKHKSSLIALFACGGMIGAASSQYVYMKAYVAFDGQTGLLAIPILLLALCCALFKFPVFESNVSPLSFKQALQIIKPRRSEIILLYFIELCLQLVAISFSFLLPDILRTKGFEEWFCLGGGCFYFIIGAALTSLPIGLCIDKFGYKPVLSGIILTSVGLIYLFLIAQSLTIFPVIVLLMLIGGTMGVIVPVAVAAGNSLVPPQASGFISALYMGGVSCLAGFGPILASLIAAHAIENAPVVALELLSLLLVVALGLTRLLPYSYSLSDLEAVSIKATP